MVEITPQIRLEDRELTFEAIRASGPGGQHVNKASTAVQLRFDAAHSPSLPKAVCMRLRTIAGSRMTREGVVIIDAREHRSQQQNREAALARLVDMLQQAARPPRVRRPTRPTLASKRRRLESKRRKSRDKQGRREPPRSE
jgi:ribosome-associated protein